MTAFGGQALSAMTSIDPGSFGLLDAYAGIGAMGPYYGMTATTSAPVILGTFRYTGSRVVKVRQFTFQPIITTAYTAPQFLTVALRKVNAYTAIDTGGTDVTAYFGAPKKSTYPSVTGIQAVVAGVPGTPVNTGLTAGTRTPLNNFLQRTVYVGTTTIGQQPDTAASLDEPLCIVANEGVEILLIASATDATGSAALAAQFEWTVEDF